MRNENGDIIDEKRNILDEIADYTRERIAIMKEVFPLAQRKAEALALTKGEFSFERALKSEGMSFICEVKKASPSKGLIAPHFPYLEIARDYEKAGATAISCLTEPYYFQGQDKYLEDITRAVSIPVLRKDFFIDEYMIYEARILGASAILLICAILTDEELSRYFQIAEELGLSALFEAHDEEEVARALTCGARVIGVNNRNLKTFQMDLGNTLRLRELVPPDVIFISESGIQTRADVQQMEDFGVDALLVGETLMRAEDKVTALATLRGSL